MAVTCDPEHKFELALQLGDLKVAYTLAKEAEVIEIIIITLCKAVFGRIIDQESWQISAPFCNRIYHNFDVKD